MLTCQFCGLSGEAGSEDFQIDNRNLGFWCESCDGYTYLSEDTVKHRFTLILEEKALKTLPAPKEIHLNKRLSVLRYPGGKSKVIDYLYTHLQQVKSKKLISPFTGGGSFELALLDAGIIEQLHLNDLDTGVYSLWWMIKHMPDAIIERIKFIQPNHKDYFSAQALIKADYEGADMIEAAWSSLLVNRLAFSGISKANPLGGKEGSQKDLLARWNPQKLIKRIERIHALSDRYEITQLNAVELIEQAYWHDNATIFIDPPYLLKGKDLYHCYYQKRDHIELACLLDSLYHGCPGADMVITYDYHEWLNLLYEFPDRYMIGRKYSA